MSEITMSTTRQYRCPQCQQPTVWSGNPDRPFCSERCRLIDLGAWIDESYRIPSEGPPGEPVDESENSEQSNQ